MGEDPKKYQKRVAKLRKELRPYAGDIVTSYSDTTNLLRIKFDLQNPKNTSKGAIRYQQDQMKKASEPDEDESWIEKIIQKVRKRRGD